ncbi:MAG: hypothetical protein BRD42_08035 [Bacteroidetes bacterium QS_3_64_15]|nr:MAG: hypothetical protein BRD42_08035 [Bacteroidetes bacterium QS_3_64_15]
MLGACETAASSTDHRMDGLRRLWPDALNFCKRLDRCRPHRFDAPEPQQSASPAGLTFNRPCKA